MTARTNWASIARRRTTKKQTKSLLNVQYSFESSAITDSKQDAILVLPRQKEATPDPADDFTMHNEKLLTEKIYYDECYDECYAQNKDQFNHHIRSDNAQTQWVKKYLCSFISSAEQILLDEFLFYEKCSSYWNKIKQKK
eukprot:420871_1